MPSLQEYLAKRTEKAQEDILKAFEGLSADKQGWKPLDKGRSAANMIAECALMNRYSTTVLKERNWPGGLGANFFAELAELEKDALLVSTFKEEAAKLVETMRAFPEAQLATVVETAFGPMTLQQIMEYPAWNMNYHEGQINYISSLSEAAG